MGESDVHQYLNDLRKVSSTGDTTEHSYREALGTLLRSLAAEGDHPLRQLVFEPGNITDAGAPDGVAYGPAEHELIGYIETKDLGKSLDALAGHDKQQLERYRNAFHALLLTNYIEFHLFMDGELTDIVSIGSPSILDGQTSLKALARDTSEALSTLLARFLSQSVPIVSKASKLAHLLAHKAKLLDKVVRSLLEGEEPEQQLLSQLDSYRNWLIPDMTEEQFADLYAQTLTYGLFYVALQNLKTGEVETLEPNHILDLLPQTIRPVWAIFSLLAGRQLPEEINWIIDDLLRLLERADMASISEEFSEGGRDPVIHFYETFLSEYDPSLRDKRGVYYTPDEVVHYIVESVDSLLKSRLEKADGLADADVTLLDPALGTGTFLVHSLQRCAATFGKAHAGDLADHLRENTLKHFFGFELLAAPYVLAHLKIGQQLESFGIADVDANIFLTNTLIEPGEHPRLPGPFEIAISEDGREADQVKQEEKILVIVGNPPYEGHSYNTYDRIDDYKSINGEPLGERNPKWLQNDYVKFIRWAERKIAESEEGGFRYGVIGLITDSSYLGGVIFRGMRKHLLDNFDEIFVLNLHGNSRVQEILPPGIEVDQSVFEIMQGVSISIFVRSPSSKHTSEIHYADIWGTTDEKLDFLRRNDVLSTSWQLLDVGGPAFMFIPREAVEDEDAYQQSPSLPEIFPINSMAIVTGQDAEVYSQDRETLERRYFKEIADRNVAVLKAAYRPFDNPFLAYGQPTVTRRRQAVMMHQIEPGSLGLTSFRHTRRQTPMRVFASRHVMDARLLSGEANCYTYPLFKASLAETTTGQIGGIGTENREYNISNGLLDTLSSLYEFEVTGQMLFSYIYGVLNAPAYQAGFEALLQDDFPRIPFTVDPELFVDMVELGSRVLDLHILEASELQGITDLSVGFPVEGADIVEAGFPTYSIEDERVYINSDQYFDGINPGMWAYAIGAYNPIEKYLSDRRDLELSAETRRHVETFATAISHVVELLPQLDVVWEVIVSGELSNPLANAEVHSA